MASRRRRISPISSRRAAPRARAVAMSSSPASTGPKPSSAMPARWAASARAAAIRSASARLPVTRLASLPTAAGWGAGGHLAALVLDPALGLVLLRVLEAGQAALQRLPLGPAGLPVRFGRPLGGDGDAAGGPGPP